MAKPITIKITGDTSGLDKAVGNVGSKMDKLAGFGAVAGPALAAAFVGAGVALVGIGQKFEDMENIIVKGTGASGEALEGLTESAKNVLKAVPESADVVGGILADVNTFFGATGTELEGLTEGFLDFARVAEVDASAAVGQLDAAMTQFGIPLSEADEAMGDFLRISQATGIPMEKLLKQMETFGPIFSNAGFSLEETTAIFGQLEQAGVDVTRVGPALNKFFRTAAEAGEDPRAAFEAIIEEMKGAGSEAEALNIATAAFGAEGAQRMTSAVRSGNLSLEDLNSLMGEGTGLVDAQAKATETMGDKWNNLKNQVFVALEPIASRLFDTLKNGMDQIVPVGERVVAVLKENKPVMIAVAAVVGGALVGALTAAAVAAWGLVAPMLVAAAPFIAVGAAVAAVTAVLVYAYQEWEFFRNVVDGVVAFLKNTVWPIVKQVAQGIWEAMRESFENIKGAVRDLLPVLRSIGEFLQNTVLPVARKVFTAVTKVVQTQFKIVATAVKTVIAVFRTIITFVTGTLVPGFRRGFDNITKAIGSARRGIATAVGAVRRVLTGITTAVTGIARAVSTQVGRIVSAVSGIPGRIRGAASRAFNPLRDGFRNALNGIINGWNRLSFTFGGQSFSLGPLGSVSIPRVTISTPNVRNLAAGGPANGLTMVGERGPELLDLPEGSRVTPAHLSRGAGGDIIVNVESTADPLVIAREVAWQLRTIGR